MEWKTGVLIVKIWQKILDRSSEFWENCTRKLKISSVTKCLNNFATLSEVIFCRDVQYLKQRHIFIVSEKEMTNYLKYSKSVFCLRGKTLLAREYYLNEENPFPADWHTSMRYILLSLIQDTIFPNLSLLWVEFISKITLLLFIYNISQNHPVIYAINWFSSKLLNDQS